MGAMPLIFRKSFRFGPLRFNFTKRGFSSISFRLGRWTWNSKQREHRVDLPGAASWTSGRRRRGRG
jgi:hypothetical protein